MTPTTPDTEQEITTLIAARERLQSGMAKEAIALLEPFAIEQSLNPDIYLELGRALKAEGIPGRAVPWLRTAAQLDLRGHDALFELLDIHAAAGENGLALAVLGQMLRQGVSRQDVLGVAAEILEKSATRIDTLDWLAPGLLGTQPDAATATYSGPANRISAEARRHPYQSQPDRAFWNRAVTGRIWGTLDLSPPPKFSIGANESIVAAGSCFARHISQHLRQAGYQYLVTEQAHSLMTTEEAEIHGYGIFSARYGNIYTARQMLELIEQALGRRPMIEDWFETVGRTFDLLRPTIQPNGFASAEEARLDRRHHLACTGRALASADVFIFTLGLTEAWLNTDIGHCYPVCPGTAAGRYDPRCHRFHNFTGPEVIADLRRIDELLHSINPELKIILTVSPVPLMATMEDQHVVVASSASKAVLRGACAEIERNNPLLQYFPSYEIISASANGGCYFEPDGRTVQPGGVTHVMKAFLATYFKESPQQVPDTQVVAEGLDIARQFVTAECDELFNNPGFES